MARASGPLQVILVVSDTLRADHMGCYGYFRPTSPRMDAFAAQGVRFAKHVSQAPYTLPSFTSIITGQFGTTHKVLANPSGQNHNFPVAVDDHTPVLADVFRAAGEPIKYEVGRYVGGGSLTASFDNLINFPNRPKWFARGYEYHVNVTPGTHRMVGAEIIHRRLFPWLAQHKDEDFFLFVHYWDVHGPYLAPPGYGEQYPQQKIGDHIPVYTAPSGEQYVRGWGPVAAVEERSGADWASGARAKIDAYDGGINYFDAVFGQLLDHLDALGIGQRAVVALTSDHGESMAEHRVPFAHDELYDATIATPLIVRAPGKIPEGRVVETLSQAVDIAPTLVELAGLEAPESFQGKSLVSLANGKVERLHERSYSEWTRYLASRCVKDERHKLIQKFTGGLALARPNPKHVSWTELYDLQADPDETKDLSEELPEVRKQLEEELRDWVAAQLTPGEEDPLLRPEMACWEPTSRATTPTGPRTGGALALLPEERNPWI
ncbi:MAG TPA: sulfatase [Chloroflexota bacterium]|nr:sulfatase [Chloroflexota bacterium]